MNLKNKASVPCLLKGIDLLKNFWEIREKTQKANSYSLLVAENLDLRCSPEAAAQWIDDRYVQLFAVVNDETKNEKQKN